MHIGIPQGNVLVEAFKVESRLLWIPSKEKKPKAYYNNKIIIKILVFFPI